MTVDRGRVTALDEEFVLQTYKRQPVVFVRGRGSRLFDSEDRPYLDFITGIGVVVLGHAHPGLAAALAAQAATLIQTSNLYHHPLQGQLAARLHALSGLQRTFFCNSGSEANEACLKFARRFWFTQGHTARTEYVALRHGFAGRTMGALSVTANPAYREPFGPLIPGVTFVSADEPEALLAAVTDRTAAIIVEPIQGEGGIRPLSGELALAIEQACERTGALLIADEVQCGLGRTGHPFYFAALGLTPDLVSVGKALGSGVPIGAALVAEHVATQVSPGDHGSTYGGNLLATRAGLYVIEQLTGVTDADTAPGRSGGLLAHVNATAPVLEHTLMRLAARHDIVRSVRGVGLMRGLELTVDATPAVDLARHHGLLVNRTAERVIRMLPPLTVTPAEISEAEDILDRVLDELGGGDAEYGEKSHEGTKARSRS